MVKRRDGAVAPKERINIVYRSTADNRRVKIELPMKMLVVSDLTKRSNDTPIEQREIINVDQRNLDDVIKNMNLNLKFSVPDKISGEHDEKTIDIDMDIKRMQDFSPDKVCQNVPVLKKLLELRSSINALKGPVGNIPQFRKALESLIHDDEKRSKVKDLLVQNKKNSKTVKSTKAKITSEVETDDG